MAFHPAGRAAGAAVALVLAAALVPPGPALATDLSGNVSGTLTAAGNPYVATGPVTVPAGQTLRVEAGCVVLWQPATALDVSGRLEVAGTAGGRVTFAPSVAGATPGSWDGVTFFSGSSGDLAGLDVDGADTGVHVLGGGCDLTDVAIDRTAKYGLRVDVTASTVRNVTVTRAGQGNPSSAGIFAGGGAALFEDCTVRDCAGTGVGAWSPATPTFRDCTIATCRSGITCVGASARFEGCVVRDHGFAGNFDTGAGFFLGFATGTPVITGCTIERNFFGVAIINDGRVDLGDLGDADPANDGGNTFRANDRFDGTTRHVWNETPNPVPAEGNLWADGAGGWSVDPAVVDGWIFDDEELAGAAAVDFEPLASVVGVIGGEAGPAGDREPAGDADLFARWTLSPTPTVGPVRLSGRVPGPGRLSADLVDVAGRRVKTLDLGPVADGTLSRPLDLTGIVPGAYFLRIRWNDRPLGTARVVLTR